MSERSEARIALVGDYDPGVVAHQGIQRSLVLATSRMPGLTWEWIHTAAIGADPASRLAGFTGVWVVPASPYANPEGAFAAIRYARERPLPFLGTCGGFQHAVLEYVHNVLHLEQAAHAEMSPASPFALIAPLSCALVEKNGGVKSIPGTRFASVYTAASGVEGYHCSFGLNPQYETLFGAGPLRISARDESGEVRAMELDGHLFYIITLFQPERAGLQDRLHPLIAAFLQAAAKPIPARGTTSLIPSRNHGP